MRPFVDKNLKENSTIMYANYSFENIYDFMDQVLIPHPASLYSISIDTSMPEWHGSKSMEEAVELAKYGWKDGLTAYKNIIKDFKISFDDIIPRQDYAEELQPSTEGEIFNPEKYFEGDPEDMLKFTLTKSTTLTTGRKLQRLIINSCVSCFIETQTFFYTGVIYQELIKALEMAGFATEVWVRASMTASYPAKLTFSGECCIKSFQEVVDIDKLIFFTAHPSILRRFIFSLMEQTPEEIQKYLGINYGQVTEYNNDLVSNFGDDGTIFLPSLTDNLSKEQILENVRKYVIDKFNPDSFSA